MRVFAKAANPLSSSEDLEKPTISEKVESNPQSTKSENKEVSAEVTPKQGKEWGKCINIW